MASLKLRPECSSSACTLVQGPMLADVHMKSVTDHVSVSGLLLMLFVAAIQGCDCICTATGPLALNKVPQPSEGSS